MNIREDIHRIKQVMGINESNDVLPVKRRLKALINHIESSYDWLSPRRFNNFDDFLVRVVFSAARDFVAEEIGGEYDQQLDIREKLEPQILEFIKRNEGLYNEIEDHFISNR
jgi:hypothetical protein